MSTARDIEDAIRSLPGPERDKLLHKIPDLFPELNGDAEWERIIADESARPALTELLDKTEAEFRRDPGKFPEMTERDFLRLSDVASHRSILAALSQLAAANSGGNSQSLSNIP